jgi:aspartyl aminopeptidase
MRRILAAALALGFAFSPVVALAKDEAPKASWAKMSDSERSAANKLATDYMKFLGQARVPVMRTRFLTDLLEWSGFRPFKAGSAWKAGAKYYIINRDRALLAFVVGKEPLSEGLRLIGAHLDSPRLDLRIRPLKSSDGLLFLKTAPYGGIKRYQWANLPLALVGQVARADGKLVDVSIGEQPGDPVFVLPDLAPHVDKDFRERPASNVFKGDELTPLVASLPSSGGDVKATFLAELKSRYGLVEEDFVSAELSFVPAGAPREVGLDRGLVGGYGQDDGLCSFAAVRGLMSLSGAPEKTAAVYLVNSEEIGNINNTSIRSRFLTASIERMTAAEAGKNRPEALYAVLEATEALSADVSQALNPVFPSTEDSGNTAHVGQGFTVKSMKPGFDGSPAMRSRIRKLVSDHKIPWQTYAYKVDGGGGATIGADLQELNMDVVDVGVPLLAMHGTFELCSKADLYALHQFFTAYMAGR